MRYTGRRNQHESRHGAEVWNHGVAIGSDRRKGYGDVLSNPCRENYTYLRKSCKVFRDGTCETDQHAPQIAAR